LAALGLRISRLLRFCDLAMEYLSVVNGLGCSIRLREPGRSRSVAHRSG